MIKIINDVVNKKVQDEIEYLCLSPFFGWHYHKTSTYEHEDEILSIPDSYKKDSVDTPFFSHFVWNEMGCNSNFFPNFQPIIESIPNIENYSLIRLKLNLTTPFKKCTKDTHTYLHTDMPLYFDGDLTAIYYVNDSDGDTYIFKEHGLGDVTLEKRITPQKGRLVLFDANHPHAGNNPTENYNRVVMNINLTLKKNFQKHLDECSKYQAKL